MKRIKNVIIKGFLICVMLMSCSITTFAASLPQESSPSDSSSGSGTGYSEDNFSFQISPDGNIEMKIANQTGGTSATETFTNIYNKFRLWCAGATGIVILIAMFMLIVGFGALAIHANNSNERSRVSAGLAYKIMAVAGVVAVPLIVGLASNLFM